MGPRLIESSSPFADCGPGLSRVDDCAKAVPLADISKMESAAALSSGIPHKYDNMCDSLKASMSTIERMTITVPAEMAAVLRQTVAGGEYASTSEVVREALRDWTRRRDAERRDLEALRDAIRAGLESGPGIPAEDVYAELRAIVAERRAARVRSPFFTGRRRSKTCARSRSILRRTILNGR